MANIEFGYLYRDGGNYKKYGSVIFANPEDLGTDEISRLIHEELMPDGLFIAEQVRIPEVFLYSSGDFSQDDHCFHEFAGVRVTNGTTSDPQARSIGEFITEINDREFIGWETFDPYDSKGSYGWLLSHPMR